MKLILKRNIIYKSLEISINCPNYQNIDFERYNMDSFDVEIFEFCGFNDKNFNNKTTVLDSKYIID